MKCEGFSQITDLADDLNNNRLIAHYCAFNIMEPRPSYWTYDRVKNKFSKEHHPKSDPDCALGVHSASKQHNERRYEFYWGYKSHVLADCISGLPLYELTTPANIMDSTVAADILAAANQTIPLRECSFLADKGYDAKNIYNTVKSVYSGEALSLSKSAMLKGTGIFPWATRSVTPDFPCTRTGKRRITGAHAKNSAVPSASPEPAFALVTTRAGTMERKTGAAPNTGPFPQTTGFPLTAAAFISRERMPCALNAKDTIRASRPLDRSACGPITEQVPQTSIPWLTSQLWR